MITTTKRLTTRAWVVFCLSGALFAGTGQQARGQAAQESGLPAGEGRDLVGTACAQCHGLRTIMSLRDGRAGWRLYVYDMILRGAQVNSREAETIIDYLVRNFGPGVPLTRSTGSRGALAATLPAGAGKELVETRCVMCHDLERVTVAGRTRDDWDRIVQNMVARGATATADEARTITSYLATEFGRKSE